MIFSDSNAVNYPILCTGDDENTTTSFVRGISHRIQRRIVSSTSLWLLVRDVLSEAGILEVSLKPEARSLLNFSDCDAL